MENLIELKKVAKEIYQLYIYYLLILLKKMIRKIYLNYRIK